MGDVSEGESHIPIPHLAKEADLGPLVAHALPPGDGGGVVLALLGVEGFEPAV